MKTFGRKLVVFLFGWMLRHYFAAKAMQSKMLCDIPGNPPKGVTVAQYVANQSYIMADAMLDEAKK